MANIMTPVGTQKNPSGTLQMFFFRIPPSRQTRNSLPTTKNGASPTKIQQKQPRTTKPHFSQLPVKVSFVLLLCFIFFVSL